MVAVRVCARRRWIGAAGHRFISNESSAKEDYMTTHHHRVIAKVLVGAAIALGSWVGGAASAGADATPAGPDPNPFGALGCNCPQPAPSGSPAPMGEIEQGIRAGLAASPHQPQQ